MTERDEHAVLSTAQLARLRAAGAAGTKLTQREAIAVARELHAAIWPPDADWTAAVRPVRSEMSARLAGLELQPGARPSTDALALDTVRLEAAIKAHATESEDRGTGF